ncbi:MAG: glycosyltransferase family 2 protein [Candidatus Pacebacteria bacterium]|nr:glycosyltransferase family 2 protein [Candidatus Paceibacterota bacterium]
MRSTFFKKTSLIICVKDEAFTIGSVIRAGKAEVNEVLIVDGHSTDRTRQIARKEGAQVVLDAGLGKGEAIRRGIKKARGEILVFMDGDGSHEAKDIPELIRPIQEEQADLVLASRGKGGSDELHGNFEKMMRLIGSSVITLIINLRFNQTLTDSQNGFRAIKKNTAEELSLRENNFSIEQEMIMKALKKNCRIVEIPSHEYARQAGKSHINLLSMSWDYLWCLLKNIL